MAINSNCKNGQKMAKKSQKWSKRVIIKKNRNVKKDQKEGLQKWTEMSKKRCYNCTYLRV